MITRTTGGIPTEGVAWGYRVYQNALENNIGLKKL